ncbi:lysine 6-dehydrogenase [Methyloglobulus morosus KoM1]|uniref:Lysine 6-dehydrogenase n=1 Tax=Methyloglobulus morosus KoM1 TaxID=1116472 RepID=V5C5B3_9GAMM|nr:saccharopine dehydrogenase NADP-binding domain-containing protein [Methyloglobulus morosus]ESS73662.1 lysine 6-dehydrogenase [Methyloglobulus morosus KoM1]
MRNILILGAGVIGSSIASLLAQSGDYSIHLCDNDAAALKRIDADIGGQYLRILHLDVTNKADLALYLKTHPIEAIVSALPYYCNPPIAEIARELGLHYFDVTEDVAVTGQVQKLSQGAETSFVPQCGLAPGFISIVANELMTHFDELDTVMLRVGALPVNPSNALKYSLTWSTDGLINECGNVCYGIQDGHEVTLMPLEGYETVEMDGLLYEAFNTSGGLGTLADSYDGRVKTLNYKTLRYPGHREKILFLMNDLKLNKDRDTLKRILENVIPKTVQDVVLIYVAVAGKQNGKLYEENYVQKIYPQTIAGKVWSAIQITTAAGLCAVVDLVLGQTDLYRGFVTQESFKLSEFQDNRFGQYYRR